MILVFGKTGQVATELAALLPDARFVGRDEVDLAQPETVAPFLSGIAADAIINAAAYTAVDKAETERDRALAINSTSVGAMAEHAAAAGIPFVHISTDYVFAGDGDAPWVETDPVNPQNAYGHSKLAGETRVRQAGGVHAILRTSWVFSAHGHNFLKTMLRLSDTRDRLSIVADQIGGPTPARAIAQTCVALAKTLRSEPGKSGTYHYCGAPEVSWADFARTIITAAGRDVTVEDVPTTAYPTPAKRPLNSRLDCSAIERNFGITRPDWRAATHDIVRHLI